MAQTQMHPETVFVLEFIGNPQRGFIAELYMETPDGKEVIGTLTDCSPLYRKGDQARWVVGSLAAFHRKGYRVITRGWPSYMDVRRDKIEAREDTNGSVEEFPAGRARHDEAWRG